MKHQKPELLLPAGNTEAFYAAIRGGADAIYLGLRNFNARGRALNYSNVQLLAAVKEAHAKGVKIYVTLNTVIKNNEIKELLNILSFLQKSRVDAVIIQDWGVYFIIKRFFPGLVIHASTQMGNHNSLGVNFCQHKGIARTILARELTMKELEEIANRIQSEIELFVHGALCYSFSGMCLFSSYLGGQGANRGMCAQPCRRIYNDSKEERFIFSLKDNQQIANISDLIKNKVSSLKVEGRMKSADYVFQVAKAYRMAIDDPSKMDEAESLLQYDMGREKISYFLGNDVKDGISQKTNTGILIGKVIQVSGKSLLLNSSFELRRGNRIRIRNEKKDLTINLKLNEFEPVNNNYLIKGFEKKGISAGDLVYLVGLGEEKFPTKFKSLPKLPFTDLKKEQKQKIFNSFNVKKERINPQLFVRIDNPDWLRKIRFNDIHALIFAFTKKDWEQIDWKAGFLQQNKEKILIEFPKFISENHIDFYKKLAERLSRQGFRHFYLSHLSQKDMLPKASVYSTNENVYVYNDAAAKLLKEENVLNYTYPVENDFENLRSMKNRTGIVPVYFYPELFYSRMPVSISDADRKFKDDNNKKYRKIIKDGMTVVIPETPVGLTQYKKQLTETGFSKFLVDLSFDKPSKNLIKKVMMKFKFGEQIQPSTTFNFKKGLK